MKIIEHGDTYMHKTLKCSVCGCVFEYDTKDVEVHHFGGGQNRYVINCPECGVACKQKPQKYALFE